MPNTTEFAICFVLISDCSDCTDNGCSQLHSVAYAVQPAWTPLGSAREAMADLAENLEALEHSFFFRGFFKDRGFYDLGSLSPVEYQSKNLKRV